MGLSDDELVKRSLSGDHDSFSELVARYKRLIYSVVYKMLQDKEEVNDVSQEVFIRIYKALGKYNPEYKFSTWSVKIATNYCLDILRKKKPVTTPIEEIIEYATGDVDTPEESYIKRERSEAIRKAIASLPDKYRIPIILYHQNGLSYEEITKVLHQPMTIVKNRLYRARRMLKDLLLEERLEEKKEGVLCTVNKQTIT